jgi:hypothetical protein
VTGNTKKLEHLALTDLKIYINQKLTKRPAVPSTSSTVINMVIKRVFFISLGYVYIVLHKSEQKVNRKFGRESRTEYQVKN